MPKIKALSEHIVNKIAAGEVVERPASVIKELVENSLDAGASRISVVIEDGGKKLIRITDDGCGMASDDLEMAFAPHATSKIETDEDLFSISSFGFRGEALASIASVSQVEIVTRPVDAIEGTRMEISGGKVLSIGPASAAPGTTITIRNLFFNTPARRKFLRTANTEMGHISEQFIRMALAQTNVRLLLSHNGRTIHDLPPDQTLHQRIASLFSPELADALFPVRLERKGISVHGLVAHPQQSRTGSQWQYVFVNNRHIRDKFISHAVREAYRGLMEINRQPVVFLFLAMPADFVDVNVHPAKTEVRFSDSNLVHSLVLAAIRDRLLGSDLSVPIKTGKASAEMSPSSSPSADSPATRTDDPEEHKKRVRQAMADFFKKAPARPVSPAHPNIVGKAPGLSNNTNPPSLPVTTADNPAPLPTGKRDGQDVDADTLALPVFQNPKQENATERTAEPVSPPKQPPRQIVPDGVDEHHYSDDKPVMQIHNAFIVAQTAKGVDIIDQHALHERILYENISRQFNKGPLASQRRLIPEIVEVTPRQMSVVENGHEIFHHLGIELEPFGPKTVAVQSFPLLLEKADVEEFIRDLLDLLVEQAEKIDREELVHHIFDMMACKAAVKAGDPLTVDEIKSLLAQGRQLTQSGTCPHGRPTTITLTLKELQKQFKRT